MMNMVIEGNSEVFVEVKTGNAVLTGNQSRIYPNLSNGTAAIANGLAQPLDVDEGSTISEAFSGGFKIVTVYSAGYLD